MESRIWYGSRPAAAAGLFGRTSAIASRPASTPSAAAISSPSGVTRKPSRPSLGSSCRRVSACCAVPDSNSPSSTLTLRRSPSRTKPISTSSPGCRCASSVVSPVSLVSGSPSRETMTSPGCSPASSAGESGCTCVMWLPATRSRPNASAMSAFTDCTRTPSCGRRTAPY